MNIEDTFQGDDKALVSSIKALLNLDAAGVLVPHGIGGHARTLLSAAAVRLEGAVPAFVPVTPAERAANAAQAVKDIELFHEREPEPDWIELAGVGYAAAQAAVVPELRGPEWSKLPITQTLQWANAAEAIHDEIKKP